MVLLHEPLQAFSQNLRQQGSPTAKVLTNTKKVHGASPASGQIADEDTEETAVDSLLTSAAGRFCECPGGGVVLTHRQLLGLKPLPVGTDVGVETVNKISALQGPRLMCVCLHLVNKKI